MPDKRKRKLADTVKPVRMRDPFHFKFFHQHFSFLLQFIRLPAKVVEDHPVVYSLYSGFLTLFHVKNLFVFFDEFAEANSFYSGEILGAVKVNSCFLLMWQYFQ